MIHIIKLTKNDKELSCKEAIDVYSQGHEMILASLLYLLIQKKILKTNEIEELFEWEIDVEEIERMK